MLAIMAGTLQAQPLIERLDSMLDEEFLKYSEVGICVYDLTEGRMIYNYQDEKLYRPASIEKVITSVSAIDMMGPDFHYDTKISYTGEIRNDTLHGSLYITGGFDPLFTDADLNHLVNELRKAGIRHISDSIIADVTMTDSVYWGKGWSWDDCPDTFQPYLSPLMLNEGSVRISVIPRGAGQSPEVVCTPESDYYTITNTAVSHQRGAGPLKITRDWMHQENNIQIKGNASSRQSRSLTIFPSDKYFLTTFCHHLRRDSITYNKVTFGKEKTTTTSLSKTSRHMRPVLREALKESNNLCAESIFYKAAHRRYGDRATSKQGTSVIQRFIRHRLGLRPENYNIVDGSGVSLYNYISPRLMVETLEYAYRHNNIFPHLYDALPISGVDGTLSWRMTEKNMRSRVRAKTGSVKGVSSLAGYIKTNSGHALCFCIINQNVMKIGKARRFQDKICEILVKGI